MTPFARAVSFVIPLGVAVGAASWWAVSTAHDQSLSRPLHLPDTPYNYSNIELPRHFEVPSATRMDNTPATNPITDEGATLGRVLFYDTRLSVNNTVSCSSCHVQKHGFADPNRFSKGFDGRHTDRHAMNLVDLRYYSNHRFFWDERAPGLEETVLLPIQNKLEMGQDLTRLVTLLEADRRYPKLFRSAFGSPAITPDRIGRALSQFLRSLVSYASRYDTGRSAVASSHEDFANFTAQENRGKALFLRHCATCHMPGQDAHLSMPFPTNNGIDDDPVSADGGVGEMTLSPGDVGRFKSPSLRNVAVTGPYMHNGRLTTLDAVVDHYSSDFKRHPNLDGRMRPLNFTVREKAALVSFLHTLTDEQFLNDPKFSDPFDNTRARR
jgi:cytochrome c peroxidase